MCGGLFFEFFSIIYLMEVGLIIDTINLRNKKIEMQIITSKEHMPEIIIAADGSGASIACALLFNLRERYRNCIKHIVFFDQKF